MACINPNDPKFQEILARVGNPILAEIEFNKYQVQYDAAKSIIAEKIIKSISTNTYTFAYNSENDTLSLVPQPGVQLTLNKARNAVDSQSSKSNRKNITNYRLTPIITKDWEPKLIKIDFNLKFVESQIPQDVLDPSLLPSSELTELEEMPQTSDIQAKLQTLYPKIKLNITNRPIWEEGGNVFNQEAVLSELNKKLERFLEQFGFTTQQLNDLKEVTGYSIIGATDFLEKVIFIQKQNIDKAYTKEAAYVIFNLLGRKNLLRKDLIASIHLLDNYESLKSKYINSKLPDYSIRELIAIDYLQIKLAEAHKESLPTSNKAVSKDVTAKNKLEYTILRIKKWWSEKVRDFFKSYKKGYIEGVFNQIANDVINNNTRLFNLSKNKPYSKIELDGKIKEINDSLVKFGAVNSGSYALNKQGTLTRESINDLDYFLPYDKKDSFITQVKKKYPQAIFSEPYAGVMGNRSVTLSFKIDDLKIDLFLPTSQEESNKEKIVIIDGVKFHYWKNIFDAKIRIGSKKHLSDLSGFSPFTRTYNLSQLYNWSPTEFNSAFRKKKFLNFLDYSETFKYLDIVGQRHYNFDFIKSKYNSQHYSSAESVNQKNEVRSYLEKNQEKAAREYFDRNKIDFKKSNQYQDLLDYFKQDENKAIVAYYLTFSENFKKFFGNISGRKDLPSFIINYVSGEYSKPSILVDEFGEPIVFYHGAGTIFDKFSKDYFLSGEGAMAYGAGFYTTNSKVTADSYRDASKTAYATFKRLIEEKNEDLLKLIEDIKEEITEESINYLLQGSIVKQKMNVFSRWNNAAKIRFLELLGLTETKALYISLTNPLYWQKNISSENKELIESHFNIKLKNINSGLIYRELQKTLKITDKELSARLYQIGIDGVIRTAEGGQAVGGFSHKKGEVHVIFFEPIQAKAVNNSGLFSLNNENMYDPIEVRSDIQNQENQGRIIGQANIKAMTVLIDAVNQREDTLSHEYAHHYIAWFRDTPIVQEAIKKWGSEEALVQSIGEQAVAQKGNAWNWWKQFTQWVQNLFDNLSTKDKQELTNILTDAFLLGVDLETGQIGISEERSVELAKQASGIFNQEINPGVEELFDSNPELANQVYSALGFNNISDVTLDKPRFNPDNPEATSYPIKINGKYAGVISVNNEGYISSSIGMAGVELEKEFQGKGYGTKVYLALANKLMEEGKTLKSEAFGKEDINDSASKVWKSLLDKGLAVDKGDYFEVASTITPQQKQQALQLYSQYLDTIFPNRKVKDVLYHGTTNNKLKVTGFTKEGVGTGFHRTPQIFLSFSRRYSSFFGNNILPVIINTINPDYIEFMAVDSVSSYVETMNMARMDLTEEQWKAGNHEVDALIGIEAKTFSSYYEKYPEDEVKSVAVFSPEQIYPLGTKQDIERFKEFVGSVSNVQEAQPIIPINEMEDIIDNLPPFTKDIEDLGFTEEACDL
jgi:hypothetical protein